jgi:hypothetical protein
MLKQLYWGALKFIVDRLVDKIDDDKIKRSFSVIHYVYLWFNFINFPHPLSAYSAAMAVAVGCVID